MNSKSTTRKPISIRLSWFKHTVAIHVENEEGEPLDLAEISIVGDGDTEYSNPSGDAELKLPNRTYADYQRYRLSGSDADTHHL